MSMQASLVDQLQEQLDQSDGWDLDHRVASVIDRVGLNRMNLFDSQSGGIRAGRCWLVPWWQNLIC